MPISPVTILSVTEVGSPAQFLRVRFTHPASERANLARFAIHVDEVDDPPVWTEPPAFDLGIPQDDGGSPMEMREVLWWIADEIATEHETFEEYALGDVAGRELNRGGGESMWDGSAVVGQNDLGLRGTEDFEDYPVGVVPVLDGGIGWDGAASVERAKWEVYPSGTTYTTATSVSETIPSSTSDGDMLLAFVMHRSAITSVPSGWSLVVSEFGTGGSPVIDQWISVYEKTASIGDASTTASFSQSSSGRMGIHILCVAGSAWTVDNFATRKQDNQSIATVPIATATLVGEGIIIAAFTLIASAGTTTVTAPSGYTLSSVSALADNRLGVSLKMSSGEIASGSFGTSVGTSANGGAAITLIIKEVP